MYNASFLFLYTDNDFSGISEHSSELRLSELISSPRPLGGTGGAVNGRRKRTSPQQAEGDVNSDTVTLSASDSELIDSNPTTSMAPPRIQHKVLIYLTVQSAMLA